MASSPPAVAGARLMVATPMYEGLCHALFVRGLVELALQCRDKGIALTLKFITNQPHVNHARAYIANAFLRSDANHLMMIDADMGFAAADVFALLRQQVSEREHGVIGAAYARKRVEWDRVGRAARSGAQVALASVASSLTVNLGSEGAKLALDRPQPVDELATGFMMVSRAALEQVAEQHPDLVFRPSPDEQRTFGVGPSATAFFNTAIADDGAYLSGDFAFCRRVRAAGLRVWLDPQIELTHVGNMAFAGSLTEIAKLASAFQSQ